MHQLPNTCEVIHVINLDSAVAVELDNIIRSDIPGTEDWHGTAKDLQDTLTDPEFDPALFLIARHTNQGVWLLAQRMSFLASRLSFPEAGRWRAQPQIS